MIGRIADLPAERAVRVGPPEPIVVIGDSAIAALRRVPNADDGDQAVIGFEHTLDLEHLQASCFDTSGITEMIA